MINRSSEKRVDLKEKPVAAVVLAAGKSFRFGAQKLLIPLHGSPLIRVTVKNVLEAGLAPVVVVVPLGDEGMRKALRDLELTVVENPRSAEGLSTSIGAGVRALPAGVSGAAICLGDQPRVDASILRPLAEAFRASSRPIAAPYYRGLRGNPVIFAPEMFEALCALEGDRGARDLLAAADHLIEPVRFDFDAPIDVDTPDDFRAIAGPALNRAAD